MFCFDGSHHRFTWFDFHHQDLGTAVKCFRKGMEDPNDGAEEKLEPDQLAANESSEAAAEKPAKNQQSSD